MKQMQKHKIAGFWIRLTSRMIDVLILFLLSIGLAILFLEKKMINNQQEWIFKQNYFFYIYALIIIMLIFLLFVVLPIIWKGKTIGHFITRTKIVAENNLIFGIMKREVFWSFSWIFCAILTTAIINHTLFLKFISANNRSEIVFTNWETFRISLVSSLASIIVFMQMFLAVSIVVRQKKLGLHDVYSNTKVIYLNKFINIIIPDDDNEWLKPQKVPEIIINFIK